MSELAAIRDRIEAIDVELMDLIAERVELAADAGVIKHDRGLGARDFVVERAVVDRFRQGFGTRDLDPAGGERLAHELFTQTLHVQETGARADETIELDQALVVGGAGQMGRWLTQYLRDLGVTVVINDPGGDLTTVPSTDDLVEGAREADVVIVSVPPTAVEGVLLDLEGVETPIVEIASLKAPFASTLSRLAHTQPVASVHPMWGPQTAVLSDKFVLVCPTGHDEATAVARRLFEPTQATLVEVPLDEHDGAMAQTQVLPQAVGFLFAEVLAEADRPYEELDARGGRSFAEQAALAKAIVERDAELYRQIQALNEHTETTYDQLRAAIDRLEATIDDPQAFEDTVERYRRVFDEPMEERHP